MATEATLALIENWLDELLSAQPEYFKVNVRLKPINNIKVFLDGDNGISIEKCVQINRKLYKFIEENAFYPEGDFSLEVSSPGIDEPLKLYRQYLKNKGRIVEIIFTDGSRKVGKLIDASEKDVLLEETNGKGKKTIIQQVVIPFENIKTTTVQIQF